MQIKNSRCAKIVWLITVILLTLTTGTVHAAGEPWELGIDESHLSMKDADTREKTLDDIHKLGATWFRCGPSSGSKQGVDSFVDVVKRAKNQNLKVLVNILQLDEDYDGGNANAPINRSGWREKKLSQINLKKFTLRLQALCDAVKAEGLSIEAFEIGNEDDQAPYDADIPADRAPTPAEVKTWLRGYGQFLRAAAAEVHKSGNFPQAKIITFGMAHIPDIAHMGGHLSNPAKYVSMLSNVDGFNYLDNDSYHVDGFGTHIYVSPSDISGETARLLRQDIWALGRNKPLWITECGFLRPYKDFPNKKHQTLVEGLTEFLNAIEDFHKRFLFGPVCYYDYGNVVDDKGNFRPIADVLSKRAGHWTRLTRQLEWKRNSGAGADTQSGGDTWAKLRDSTAEEQKAIDYYRNGGSPWSMQLDFHDRAAALALFEPVTDDMSYLESCRRPENVVINGALRLQTKKAENCRARWSTGYVVSKNWKQLYGYFEARIRIATKSGINNAFWLTGDNLEIDIAEAHFPNNIHCTLHDWHKPPRFSRRILIQDHLADRMNDYGLLWLPDRLIYAFNGKAMFTIETKYAAVPAEIRFSTAVGGETWGWGKSDDPSGTEMDVYWVRAAPFKDAPKHP